MKGILFLLLCFVVFLGGCGPSYELTKSLTLQQGCETGDIDVPKGANAPDVYTINIMNLKVDADWQSTASAEQRAVNDWAAAIGLNGSTPSLANQGGTMALDGLRSLFSQIQQQETVVPPAQLPVAPTLATPVPRQEVTPVDPVVTDPVTQVESGEFNQKDIMPLREFGGKSFEWLPHTGAYYGGPVKFTFDNDCGTLTVPDAKVTTGEDGSAHNYNQRFYFCGTDFTPKPGETPKPEYNNGLASVFTAPGCIAQTVTIEYNKGE